MKKLFIVLIILALIVIAGLIITRSRHPALVFDDMQQAIQHQVSELVEKNESVRSCVLSVMKGDGSFSCSWAAGMADEKNRTPMTGDTPIYIASITKLYTATVVMRLYEQGLISLQDPMAKYLPDDLIQGIHVYQGHDYSREITIHHLLSHTSGIPDYYTAKPEGGKSLFELFVEEPDRTWTVEQTIDRARQDLNPEFAPGADASYSDTNFQLLGKIVEAVTNKQLHHVFEDMIFSPLKLEHTWMIGRSKPRAPSPSPADIYQDDTNITPTRSNGSYWADGGIVSTARECIVFLKALNDGRLIKKETLSLMHDWHKLRFPLQYGYGTMRFELPGFVNRFVKAPALWGHSGSPGSWLYYSPDLDLYLAGTINQTESQSTPFKLMIKVIKMMQGEE